MFPAFSTRSTRAVTIGFVLHLLFNRLESKERMFKLYFVAILAPLLAAVAPELPRLTLLDITTAVVRAYGLSFATLISSTVLYRISPLHPLWGFPGPLLARATKFWAIYQTSTGKQHEVMLRLHRKYGPALRVGPNEISISDESCLKAVLGNDGMPKGPMWEGRRDPRSHYYALIAVRDTAQHLKRRRVWNKAFNAASVKGYEPALIARVEQLVEILREKGQGGNQLDIAHWLSMFAYDFMGDMAFGGGFELMKNGDTEGVWDIMERGIRVQAYTQHVPWAAAILYSLPGMGNSARNLIRFVVKMAKTRISRGALRAGADLSYHLLDEASPNPNPPPLPEYSSDAFLAIVAGSDTSATVLSCTLYFLMANKDVMNRLRDEIDRHFPPMHDPSEHLEKLENLLFLNAVINESMRLMPPVPVGLQRAPPPGSGGKQIGNIFIPEGTGVYVPVYVLHRDERYFSPDPDVFRPERWLQQDGTNFVTNENAFIPFSMGPMNCAGRLLAQLELRLLITTLVREFDMEFVNGWDPANWEEGLKDYFIIKKGELPTVLKHRR